MFTDKELDILEIDVFPVVTKYNDLQKVFENLNDDQVLLFSKGCQYEGIDISNMTIGTYGKEENDVLYLCGFPTKGYKEYEGVKRHGSENIKEVITKSKIILPENCVNMFDWCEGLISIKGPENGNTSKVKNMDGMFHGCEKLEFLNVSNGNVSKVEGMFGMFTRCRSLENLDVSNGNVSNVRDMRRMFYDCEKLEFLNVSNGDVSNVYNMYEMFAGCESLKKLDVSNGNVSNVENMYGMFLQCKSLTALDVSNGDVSNVYKMYSMFAGCEKLEFLNVSNGDVSKVRDMRKMFRRCKNLIELKGILNGDLSSLKYYGSMFDDTYDFKDKDKIKQKFGVK